MDLDLGHDLLARTRRSLHGVAEGVLAGPQYRTAGTIRLRVTPGGFATIMGPVLAVDGTDLVVGARAARRPLTGTFGELAATVGVEFGPPEGLYHDHSGVTADDLVDVEPGAARLLEEWFAFGDRAMLRFAPDQTPVLWPEHFDLGISLDSVNYGASPGDSFSREPYAYVGPRTPREGPFWNAPFGAFRRRSELADVDGLVEFFTDGRRRAAAG